MTEENREDNIMFDLEQLMEHGMPAMEVKAPAEIVPEVMPAHDAPIVEQKPVGLPIKNIRISETGYVVVLQNGGLVTFKISEADVFYRSVHDGQYFG